MKKILIFNGVGWVGDIKPGDDLGCTYMVCLS